MEEKQNAENKMSKQGIDSVKSNSDFRTKKIIQTSIAGIVTNILLAVFKAVIGIMTNSIAIVLDAVNNASDVASSVVTIAGTKLSKKEPDKAHPFGHGRIEYLSAMIIAVIILYAGITSAVEAVKKIITPDIPSYSTVPLIIVAVAVVVKIVLGRYVKTVGVMVKSDSLINSGIDASMDAVISAATLVAAVIYLNFNISVEAYLGVIISIFIIKAGIDMLRETLSHILGEAADSTLAQKITETVMEFPEVTGAYDLVLHDYGPDVYQGSLHIEIPDIYTADKIDMLTRKIAVAVYEKHNVVLTAIGIYSLNSTDKLAVQIKDTIEELVMMNPYILQMHGFYFNKEEASIRFDLVVSFEAKDRRQVYEYVVGKIQKHYPEYKVEAVMDTEYSDVTDNK
ncbi:cation diffusion facilitator family transporter [Catonella morbi ATCC 51271]|uniref:Cation diffusion facilitator family transporter n=1 Tax=Catonella morbi ATCC 51271 TaxID=592026 RepID=V2XL53_9FIRM|nr:cation diffusion facilitator family transporter [Catonella morbi]ESL02909.1 cation diffusion facilitator family transporter [Catonella morbi ATCC 51271]